MEEDPYYSPDDLGIGLYGTAYEDQTGFPGGEPLEGDGREGPALRALDDDTPGRTTGLPTPDREALLAERRRQVAAARAAIGHPSNRRGVAEAAGGDLSSSDALLDQAVPGGGAGDTGLDDLDDGERARVYAYLENPNIQKASGSKSRIENQADPKRFTTATFAIEVIDMKLKQAGGWRITLDVPFEDRDQAFALCDAPGLLLEATVKRIERGS